MLVAAIASGMLGLAGLASAQSGSGSAGGQPLPPGSTSKTYEQGTTTPPQNLRIITLRVLGVNKEEHTVNFQAKVKPEANIMQSGQPIALDQLKPGDEVRASFDPSTGDVVKLDVTKAK
ncbi:MAG: hypothetical protein QM765_00945 [Myxococcales bacterium]